MANYFFGSSPFDEIGSLQLHDAPPPNTQPSQPDTQPLQQLPADHPLPETRTRRAPDPFSHGSRHTKAAQRAARKRGRI